MSKLIQIAKEWVGTPWVHNQSVKGLGCDCVGFIVGIGREAGIIPNNFQLENYNRIPRQNELIKTFDNLPFVEAISDYQAEDILIIKLGNIAGHVALCLGDEIIHSDVQFGVHIVSINYYKNLICKTYRIKSWQPQ